MRLSLTSVAFMAIATLAPAASAVPTWPWGKPQPRDTDVSKLMKYFPQLDGLPQPTGLKLKYVALGLGTQNYTCTTGNDTAAPVNVALATLYDIGTILANDPFAQWKINSLSGLALQFYQNARQQEMYLQSSGFQNKLGMHYFVDAAGSLFPDFDLNSLKTFTPTPLAAVKKINSTAAPKSSCPGTTGEGAIAWLYLSDRGGSTGPVNSVYRVETAGGAAPATCKGQPASFNVPYAAQYWMFGSQ